MRPDLRRVRVAMLLAIVGSAPSIGGCTSVRPLRPGNTVRAPSPLRVWYSGPQQLRIVSAAGDTLVLGEVRELTGIVESVSGDTLNVRLQSVNRRTEPASGGRVQVLPSAADRVEARQHDAAGSALVFLLGFAAALGAAFLIVWASHDG